MDGSDGVAVAAESYDAAMERLRDVVLRLEQGGMTLSELRESVGECDRLIRYCHGELRGVREEVERVTEDWVKLDRDERTI